VRVDLVMTPDDFSRPSPALRDSLTADTTRLESDKLDARSQGRRSSLADTTALRLSSTFPVESVCDDDAGGASTGSERTIPAGTEWQLTAGAAVPV